MIGVAQIHHLVPRVRRLAWLPVPAYVALIATLYITLSASLAASLVFDPPGLMLVSNTLFFFSISLAVFTTAMRAYLASGSPSILLLGCGVLALGSAALVGGWVRPLGGTANTSVTIHNLGVLLGATLHAISALLTLLKTEPEEIVERRRQKLLFGFAGTLVLIAIIIAATLQGIVPVFWAADAGSTPIKQVVLGIAVVLLALTSIYTMVLYFQNHRYFLWWYSIGLTLTCSGLVGITLMKAVGDPIGWAGRTAQYLGGVYFLIAALSALREAQAHGLTLEMAIDRFYRRSGVYYRDLVDTVSEAIISIDERRRVLLWNQGAEKMLGYAWSEAAGRLVNDLLMPEGHRDRLDDELRDLQGENAGTFATKELEIEIRRKDGTLFPSEISLSVRRTGAGWTATLVIRDITERKRVEEALRRSQQLFSSIFRTNPAATILSWWADGRCVDANEAYARLVGYTREELIGKTTVELNIWLSAEERRRVVTELAEKGHLENVELTLRKKNGELINTVAGGEVLTMNGERYIISFFFDITERKRIEAVLQKSEERYRSLFESMAEGFALHEIIRDDRGEPCDYRFLEVNPAFERLTGLKREEVVGRTHDEVLPDDSPLWVEAYGNVVLTGTPTHFEHYSPALKKFYEVFAYCPAPLQFAVLFRDITARKQMEEALRESEEKYRTLVEQSLQGTWVIQDMRIVFCNQTFATMGGWTIPEVLSWSPEEVTNTIHPDDQKRVWGRFRERLEGKQLPLENNQLRAFRKDGSIAWIEYDARRVHLSGRPAMLISVLDITERRETEKALLESEQRYRQLAESAQDFIFIVDQEGTIRYINSAGAEEFGCDPDQIVGKSMMSLFLPDTGKRQWNRILEVVNSGHALPNKETKVTFPTREVWLNTSLMPLRTETGEVTRVLGIARDVTERKQAEEALRESETRYRQLSEENARLLEQARQDAQTKTILLQEVNHRVKNNLASIIGLIQAQERFRKNKSSPEFRSMCKDLAGRVQGLAMAHNLLSAAGWSSVKLTDLATEVIHSTLQILPSDRRVSVHVSPTPVRITPDQANTLALVINELATNTIKHGQSGKHPSSISVCVEENDGQILFEFRDDGPGYPGPIFDEKHYHAGLYLVTNLVRRDLRGEVTLRSEHGAVTRIQF